MKLLSEAKPTASSDRQPPAVLANTTTETFIQDDSSCMGCHQTAKTTAGEDADFSFLLSEAQ